MRKKKVNLWAENDSSILYGILGFSMILNHMIDVTLIVHPPYLIALHE